VKKAVEVEKRAEILSLLSELRYITPTFDVKLKKFNEIFYLPFGVSTFSAS